MLVGITYDKTTKISGIIPVGGSVLDGRTVRTVRRVVQTGSATEATEAEAKGRYLQMLQMFTPVWC